MEKHLLLISKGYKPRRGLVKNCEFCEKEFYVSQVHKKQLCCCQEHTIKLFKKRAFRFNCLICEKEVFVQPCQIKYRHRKTCSIKCKGIYERKKAEERRIEKGYTKHQLDRLARYSPEAKKWRGEIFKRDNWTCQICKIRGGVRLEADHIKPFAFFPKLRFELSNGRTLCRKCHDKTKMDYRRMRKIYEKNTG